MRVRLIVILAILSAHAMALAPAPLTVANCSTDSECENGPDIDATLGD